MKLLFEYNFNRMESPTKVCVKIGCAASSYDKRVKFPNRNSEQSISKESKKNLVNAFPVVDEIKYKLNYIW